MNSWESWLHFQRWHENMVLSSVSLYYFAALIAAKVSLILNCSYLWRLSDVYSDKLNLILKFPQWCWIWFRNSSLHFIGYKWLIHVSIHVSIQYQSCINLSMVASTALRLFSVPFWVTNLWICIFIEVLEPYTCSTKISCYHKLSCNI